MALKLFCVVGAFLCLSTLTCAQEKVTIGGKEYVVFIDGMDRPSAISRCATNNARLVDFDTHDEQKAVAEYLYFNDYPYLRSYWTDGRRMLGQPNRFYWETSGQDIDSSVLWADGEPSPDNDKDCLFFLPETQGLITGASIYVHSVICEVN